LSIATPFSRTLIGKQITPHAMGRFRGRNTSARSARAVRERAVGCLYHL
jgi:hypothetical protein